MESHAAQEQGTTTISAIPVALTEGKISIKGCPFPQKVKIGISRKAKEGFGADKRQQIDDINFKNLRLGNREILAAAMRASSQAVVHRQRPLLFQSRVSSHQSPIYKTQTFQRRVLKLRVATCDKIRKEEVSYQRGLPQESSQQGNRIGIMAYVA
jgi:hypothetical protein